MYRSLSWTQLDSIQVQLHEVRTRRCLYSIWPNGIIFHQPRFPWNKRVPFPFQNATCWGPRSCELHSIPGIFSKPSHLSLSECFLRCARHACCDVQTPANEMRLIQGCHYWNIDMDDSWSIHINISIFQYVQFTTLNLLPRFVKRIPPSELLFLHFLFVLFPERS